jgi:hypothetical protein
MSVQAAGDVKWSLDIWQKESAKWSTSLEMEGADGSAAETAVTPGSVRLELGKVSNMRHGNRRASLGMRIKSLIPTRGGGPAHRASLYSRLETISGLLAPKQDSISRTSARPHPPDKPRVKQVSKVYTTPSQMKMDDDLFGELDLEEPKTQMLSDFLGECEERKVQDEKDLLELDAEPLRGNLQKIAEGLGGAEALEGAEDDEALDGYEDDEAVDLAAEKLEVGARKMEELATLLESKIAQKDQEEMDFEMVSNPAAEQIKQPSESNLAKEEEWVLVDSR